MRILMAAGAMLLFVGLNTANAQTKKTITPAKAPAHVPVKAGTGTGIGASITRGKAVYTQYCLTCHQVDGGGVPRMNPPLIQTDYVKGDNVRLIKVILAGFSEKVEIEGDVYANIMPAHNFLTDQQVADVLTYIRNSFTNKGKAILPAQVQQVRATLPSK